MAVPHLVCAVLFFSMICSSFLGLVPNLDAHPNKGEKLMVELVSRARNVRNGLKMTLFLITFRRFLPGYHNFNEGARSAKKIEVKRG